MRCTHWRRVPLDLVREARERLAAEYVDSHGGVQSRHPLPPHNESCRDCGGSGTDSSGKSCGTCNGLGEIYCRAGRHGLRGPSRSTILKEGR